MNDKYPIVELKQLEFLNQKDQSNVSTLVSGLSVVNRG